MPARSVDGSGLAFSFGPSGFAEDETAGDASDISEPESDEPQPAIVVIAVNTSKNAFNMQGALCRGHLLY
jgi:hypothetical protein